MTPFVDATGFPVLPVTLDNGREYWYREDVRIAHGDERFWGSPRWLAVQRLLDGLYGSGDAPWKQRRRRTRNEIAFEV